MDLVELAKRYALRQLEVDPKEIQSKVTQWLLASGGDKEAARRLAMEHYAREAAKTGFLSGLVPGVLVSLVFSVFDARGMAKHRAGLTASYAVMADPTFFDHPDYTQLIARSLAEGNVARTDHVRARGWASTAVRFHATQYIARAVRSSALRWAGKRAIGGVPGVVVPIVGGLVGGAWNYAEIRFVAARYDNDPEPVSVDDVVYDVSVAAQPN